ncbi:PD-(D/E)XK nuclease family protein [Candidatus Pacearchaeota archaeon]|nr:MAG: PD-(D/E)XK nuclease family protein [Candidatus Pacearchaeota archaeon]
MAVYSHSKISTFETCPYKYKLKYIDKVKVDIPTTIEAFMGDLVHQCLKKLYEDKKFFREVSKQSLIRFYEDLWGKNFTNKILIAKADQGLTAENYFLMGLKFLEDYYDTYKPFDEWKILGLETQDMITLPDGNKWHVRIDKLACDDFGNYYVCDYKTSNRMKDKEEVDSDRQLALYSVWVREKFKDVKSVKLVWYMLAFNKKIISERSQQELEKLQEEVCLKIKEIESEKDFPRKPSSLCNYCVYQEICPSFKHFVRSKEGPDEGKALVDEYSKIRSEIKRLREKEGELKEKIIGFAQKNSVDAIYGTNSRCSVVESKRLVLPKDKSEIIRAMKEKGIYDNFSMISYPKLNSAALSGSLDKEILEKCSLEKEFSVRVSSN